MKSTKDIDTNHTLLRHMLYGAIAGLAAGIIMTPFLILVGVIVGIDPNTISIARGMAFGFNNDNNMLYSWSCNASVNKYYGWHNICYIDYKS